MQNPAGKIVIQHGASPWPHEMRTAQTLSDLGHTVEFVWRNDEKFSHSADAYIDGILFEFKAPKSDKAGKVEKTLREALHQSEYVVFDARRMKLHEAKIRHELDN